MSEKRSAADIAVQGATNRAALEICLEPLRLAARDCGYAIALHGSVSRDIDIIAIPWVDRASDPDELITVLRGVLMGTLGRCYFQKHQQSAAKKLRGTPVWKDKPHGRRVCGLHAWVGETSIHFDFGVMPLLPKATEQ